MLEQFPPRRNEEPPPMAEHDPPEAVELERAADWRIKKLGEDPGDRQSAAAAELLQKLADDLRRRSGSPAWREYQAICGWLDESDGTAELGEYAHAYRMRIGIDAFPADGDAYLRVLIGFAKETFGAP
jgi:hypothetical protein